MEEEYIVETTVESRNLLIKSLQLFVILHWKISVFILIKFDSQLGNTKLKKKKKHLKIIIELIAF